jgi:hypothetical protein
MGQIFISYAHTDSDFVELLRIKLKEAGFTIWVDHTGIKAGTDWVKSLDDAIRDSVAVIVVMSPDSMNSHYVTYEWAFAHGLEKPIIPLLYKKTNSHKKLSDLQYLDFTHRTIRPWEQLFERIEGMIHDANQGN